MAVECEWGVEITTTTESDRHEVGEVLDTFHCATYREAMRITERGVRHSISKGVIVLIRDDDGGERLWAYLREDGTLPETFADAFQEDSGVRVPKRFHVEVARAAPSRVV